MGRDRPISRLADSNISVSVSIISVSAKTISVSAKTISVSVLIKISVLVFNRYQSKENIDIGIGYRLRID